MGLDSMDFPTIVTNILNVLLSPLQLILVPFDSLLAGIPGIGIIPASISSIIGFVGTFPQTLCTLFGISPVIWNALISVFIVNFTALPAIQLAKKVWAWVRL